jgi:hypothetical protein
LSKPLAKRENVRDTLENIPEYKEVRIKIIVTIGRDPLPPVGSVSETCPAVSEENPDNIFSLTLKGIG